MQSRPTRSARDVAFQVLMRVESGGYASDLLRRESEGLAARDAALAEAIVLGSLRTQMQLDFLGKLPLRAKAVAVSNNQHPDHHLRVYRGPTDLAVIGRKLLMHIVQNSCQKDVYPSEQVSSRNS